MLILAIIPARGGSKGIPKKNIRILGGKPLVAHTIEQARRAKGVDRVVVSTDDSAIGAVAVQYGAEVVWRPAEISGDSASSEAALLHVLDELQKRENYRPDVLLFLQCTSPLTLAMDIDGTLKALCDHGADTALAATPFHYFLWKPGQDGSAEGINHDKQVRLLRQDRKPEYLETGAIYAMRADGFLKTKHRFFGKTALYVMPPERCLEIDEPSDLAIAEARLRAMSPQPSGGRIPQPVSALILDFDGVFTDNRVLVDEGGKEAVFCSRGDGIGLSLLKKSGVPILVLSSECNPVVKARCKKLELNVIQNSRDKAVDLRNWCSAQNVDLSHAIYLGNDVNDLPCFPLVGCPVVVSDAHALAKASARLILASPGGNGAIRELCDLILSAKQPPSNDPHR